MHLEPPPSQSGVHGSYTSGAKKCPRQECFARQRFATNRGADTAWRPEPQSHLRPTLRRRGFYLLNYGDGKMVAASGIAPDSPRLQRGANLSQLRSPSAGSGPAARMVPPRGNAPRSPGYRPGALLLSYGGSEIWHPHPVMLRGLLAENQTCCFCTMRALVSLARFALASDPLVGRKCVRIKPPAPSVVLRVGQGGTHGEFRRHLEAPDHDLRFED